MTLEEWPTDGACDLGLGNAGPWIGRGQTGADRECPAVKQKVAKAGLLIDGRVWVADGANKRPLGVS